MDESVLIAMIIAGDSDGGFSVLFPISFLHSDLLSGQLPLYSPVEMLQPEPEANSSFG